MTGPEHYRVAERLVALAAADGDSEAATLAQVHATLALAAATAIPAEARTAKDRIAWKEACGGPKPHYPAT